MEKETIATPEFADLLRHEWGPALVDWLFGDTSGFLDFIATAPDVEPDRVIPWIEAHAPASVRDATDSYIDALREAEGRS